MKSYNDPQPPPVKNDLQPVWPTLIEMLTNAHACADEESFAAMLCDMRERHLFGMSKYKEPLRPSNGRDAIVDAYQEALDLCAYSAQSILEGKVEMADIYTMAVGVAYEIRQILMLRDGPTRSA